MRDSEQLPLESSAAASQAPFVIPNAPAEIQFRRISRGTRISDFHQLGGRPYGISIARVPNSGECENLLVRWALSSTHIAFGSIRMKPVFMILSQSRGLHRHRRQLAGTKDAL